MNDKCPRCGSDDPWGLDTECCISKEYPGAIVIAHYWHKQQRREQMKQYKICPNCGERERWWQRHYVWLAMPGWVCRRKKRERIR